MLRVSYLDAEQGGKSSEGLKHLRICGEEDFMFLVTTQQNKCSRGYSEISLFVCVQNIGN